MTAIAWVLLILAAIVLAIRFKWMRYTLFALLGLLLVAIAALFIYNLSERRENEA